MTANVDQNPFFADLIDAFTKATDYAENGILQSPGSAGLAAIITSAGFEKDIDKIKEGINTLGWDEEHNYDLDDWQELCIQLGCDKDSDFVSGYMDTTNDDDNKLADAIQERLAKQKFPALLPCECAQAEDQLIAEWALEFVRKIEYVEIQTFIEEHKSAFFKDHPDPNEISFRKSEAQWIRDNYYVLVKRFYLRKFLDSGVIAHRFEGKMFLPFLPVASAGNSEAQVFAKGCLAQVEESDLSEFGMRLIKKWGVVRTAVEGLQQDLVLVFEKFLLEAYYQTMDEVIYSRRSSKKKQRNDKMIPKISVDTKVVCKEERLKREELLQYMTNEDFLALEKQVQETWQNQLNSQSEIVKACLPQEAPTEFWESNYYKTAFEMFAHYLPESRNCQNKAQIVPKVGPGDGCTSSEEISERQALLAQLTEDLAKKIELRVKGKWKNERERQTPVVMAFMPIEPPQEFWEQEYYKEAAQVLLQKVDLRHQNAEKPTSKPTKNAEAMGMDLLFASSSQMTWSLNNALTDAVEFISSRRLLSSEALEGLWNFEGVLMYNDEVPRSYERNETSKSPLKRKSSDPEEPNLSMDVLVADRLGPVMINLKDSSVKSFLQQIADTLPNEKKPTLKFTNLRAVELPKNTWNGKILTHMRVLQSSSKKNAKSVTSVTRSGGSLSPYMSSSVAYEVPIEGVLTDLLGAKHQFVAPFRVSTFGTIVNVQEVTSTSNGSPKVFFHLVDKAGAFVLCCALGHNAVNTAVKDNMEATLYFGTGRNAIGSSPGAIYFMKDALIVPVGMKPMPPTQRVEIVIE